MITECGRGESFGVVWARALVREGAAVVVADPDPGRAEAVARELAEGGGRAAPAVIDLLSPGSCQSLVDEVLTHFGRVDVLANTHHTWHDLRRDDASDTYLQEVLDYNAVSILRTARGSCTTIVAAAMSPRRLQSRRRSMLTIANPYRKGRKSAARSRFRATDAAGVTGSPVSITTLSAYVRFPGVAPSGESSNITG